MHSTPIAAQVPRSTMVDSRRLVGAAVSRVFRRLSIAEELLAKSEFSYKQKIYKVMFL